VTLDDETSIFGFNDSYKRKYPIDKYQKLPEIEAQLRQMEERQVFGVDSYNSYGDAQRQLFNEYIESQDLEHAQLYKDRQHTQDKNRSLLKDIESRMENYAARKQKVTGHNIVNSREVGFMRSKLKEEYMPKPKKPEETPEGASGADAKLEEKFEPYYEGEGASNATASDASETATTETTSKPQSSDRPKRDFKKGPYKQEGGFKKRQ